MSMGFCFSTADPYKTDYVKELKHHANHISHIAMYISKYIQVITLDNTQNYIHTIYNTSTQSPSKCDY